MVIGGGTSLDTAGVVHGYPSPQVPALPHVHVRVPREWTVKLLPGSLFVVTAPLVEGVFTANVLVTSVRVSAVFALATAEQELRRTLAAMPDVHDIGSGARAVGGVDGYAHDVAFRTSEGHTLVQLHWLGVLARGSCSDLVHLTASCSAERGDEELAVLRDIVASAKLEVPA